MTTRYHLRPMDVSLFRDSRPFAPDEMSRASALSVLPPGTALYSALRALLLEEGGVAYPDFHASRHPEELQRVVGRTPDEFGTLELRGPFLSVSGGEEAVDLLPWPADLVAVDEERAHRWAFLGPVREENGGAVAKGGVETNLPGVARLVPWIGDEGGGVRSPRNGASISQGAAYPYLCTDAGKLREYLCGREFTPRKPEAVAGDEVRVGIERDAQTFTARTGRLYSVEFTRLREDLPAPVLEAPAYAHFSFEVVGDEGKFPDSIILALGGERRPFLLQKAESAGHWAEARVAVRQSLLSNGFDDGGRLRLKLYVLTPAVWVAGWRPDLPVGWELVGAAVGKPMAISGWDIRKREPRPGRYFAPAGSVYFVRAVGAVEEAGREAAVEAALETFWMRSLCQAAEDRKRGFGMVLPGGVPDAQ